MGPALSFRVAEGWRLGLPVDGPILTLERPDTPGGVVTVTRFEGDAFTDSSDPSSLTLVEPSAARLVEIIAGNPYLEPDAAEPTTAGDFAGLSLDVFTPPYTECRLPFLLLWAVPVKDGEFVQVAGQQSRFIAVDVGPDVLVVAIETPSDVPFAFFAEAATDVLDTLQIEPALTTR